MRILTLRPVNTYALKWRGARLGMAKAPRCGEMAPFCPGVSRRFKTGCRQFAYHKGLHRVGQWAWSAGDRSCHKTRGRRPIPVAPCHSAPGEYCFTHKVRHYSRRGRA